MEELLQQVGISLAKEIFDAFEEPVVVIDAEEKIALLNNAAMLFFKVDFQRVNQQAIDQIIPDLGLSETVKTGREIDERRVFNGIPARVRNIPLKKGREIMGALSVLKPEAAQNRCSTEFCAASLKNEELDAIIESFDDGIWVLDQDGVTLRVNGAYEKLSGIPAKTFIGRNVRELQAEGYFADSCCLQVLEKKKPVSIITTIKTKDGLKTVLNTGKPIFDKKGNIWRVITQNRDISEIMNLKAEIEKARQISDEYKKELEELKAGIYRVDEMVFCSEPMKEILNLVKRLSKVDSTVLVLGETGVGKDVIAKTIHNLSTRKNGPFIKVNCGAIPDSLLESEIFGYEDGSFTGAKRGGKAGLFELAHGGTLFLDEIGELPLNLQVKLLQVIEEKQVLRVGGSNPKKVDVRIIAATNRDLSEMVDKGTFRRDLFYRLNVVTIMIPPLRERMEDLSFLVNYFLQMFNKKYGFEKNFSSEAMECLLNYQWPGNIRELKNVIEKSVIVCEGDKINPEHLPAQIVQSKENVLNALKIDTKGHSIPLKRAIQELEKKLIEHALKCYGSTRKAARALNVDQSTIVRKAQKYKIIMQ
ncbi:sigma 54-interacting transcriptional regulator [Desulfofundulus sp. TPOSR]|uniref:sigma 54-interacting transcriptional regulator n=1 Tax=Desulfofundulus sp. TPOSR TaxID=2714340 RepID=UPI00140E1B58|nr:sigma 54-interacting transcriptional regulator [Desulfofundulus sp. TPOSR]NHM28761.1 sigma 54-interacting transcriptional regulator [Desulfofundulus sp. TPOSR]